eukprot:TRINITY_DN1761_c0_g1_i8.p1 TRINITY_DN1761_c0_g1~~TRINITY_DN1761_c0_g1_i8.p1  ORF type:complete len:153 (-),score=24.50 TRINITY_DN1761_c0_g1_i8:112-570(-)
MNGEKGQVTESELIGPHKPRVSSNSIIGHCISSYIELSEKQLPLLSQTLSELSNDLGREELSPRAESSQEQSSDDAAHDDDTCSPLCFALAGRKPSFCTISPFKQGERAFKKANSCLVLFKEEQMSGKANFSPDIKPKFVLPCINFAESINH